MSKHWRVYLTGTILFLLSTPLVGFADHGWGGGGGGGGGHHGGGGGGDHHGGGGGWDHGGGWGHRGGGGWVTVVETGDMEIPGDMAVIGTLGWRLGIMGLGRQSLRSL